MPTGVYARPSIAERFESKYFCEPNTGCFIWTASVTQKGYGKLGVEGGAFRLAHRVAWELFVGPIPDGLWVLHKCDNPPCVNIDHLYLGTNSDNMRDCVARGRFTQGWKLMKGKPHPIHGERHRRARLNDEAVYSIRASRLDSLTLARQFNVTRPTIHAVRQERTWKHLLIK